MKLKLTEHFINNNLIYPLLWLYIWSDRHLPLRFFQIFLLSFYIFIILLIIYLFFLEYIFAWISQIFNFSMQMRYMDWWLAILSQHCQSWSNSSLEWLSYVWYKRCWFHMSASASLVTLYNLNNNNREKQKKGTVWALQGTNFQSKH